MADDTSQHAQFAAQEAAQRDLAYHLWEQDGRPEGRADHYWHRAGEQLRAMNGGHAPAAEGPKGNSTKAKSTSAKSNSAKSTTARAAAAKPKAKAAPAAPKPSSAKADKATGNAAAGKTTRTRARTSSGKPA